MSMIPLDLECPNPECVEWRRSAVQVNNIDNFAAMHKVYYKGNEFAYCPWCGSTLKETHKMEG